jgi:hypothetical protein
MAMVSSTIESGGKFPLAFVCAAHEAAARTADKVQEVLLLHGLARCEADGRVSVPPYPLAFLLELAAAVTLENWESIGLISIIGTDLPDSQAALESIAARLADGFDQFASLADAILWNKVNEAWCSRLAWDGDRILQAGAAILADDDELVDALAKFLWTNRPRSL